MNSTINNRIAALRAHIAQEQIQAFIIPSTDPHLSEYVAPHWQSREWISGFTGSAGTVVVTAKDAGLWTDSRYFLQAARQLEGTCITLYKEMLPETPNIPEFLSAHLQEGDCVGIDGKMFSAEEVEHLQKELKKKRHLHKKHRRSDATVVDRPTCNAFSAGLCLRHKVCRNELYRKVARRPAGHGSNRGRLLVAVGFG